MHRKCFCGERATHHVKIEDQQPEYRFADHPRCRRCTQRARRSYSQRRLTITELC